MHDMTVMQLKETIQAEDWHQDGVDKMSTAMFKKTKR
jgi:hypothetical protein